MAVSLITTKLIAPPLRQNLVARQELLKKLDQGVENGFVLISAPAGYGKTTLLSTWLNHTDHKYAWISLDPTDNDLAHFLGYLTAALSRIDSSLGEVLKEPFRLKPQWETEKLLTPMINQLSQAKQPVCIILDDYHVIQDQAVHQAIRFILEHRPAQFRIVIASRTDPPLPLSNLRAHSQIYELRSSDLRFSSVEIEEFLNRMLGLNISKNDLILLETSTEGWIAGLQMAGLSLKNKEDISGYIRSFSGANRYTLEFLFDEILQMQTDDIQNFLLQSSILERLSASLCDHVLMRQDSKSILDYLERSNLFLIALDDQREWFRYHFLFQVLLHQQLKHRQSQSIPSIHLRASEWYEQTGNLPQAIDHAFESKDFHLSARLIALAADSTLLNGEIKTFLNWVEKLPEDVALRWPLLCVYHAEALLLAGKPMDQIEKRLEGSQELRAIEALKASYQGNVELSKRLSAQALGILPKESVFLRGVITSALGAVLLLSGDVEPALETFNLSAKISKESGNLMLAVIALSRLGQLYKVKGELQRADKIIREALELSRYRSGSYLSVASLPLMSLANLKYELNELGSALDIVQKAIELSNESGGFWSIDCYLVYAQILQAKGNTSDAREAMREARKIASQTSANRFDDIYSAAYEAQLYLAQDDLTEVVQWARSVEITRGGDPLGSSVRDQSNLDQFHLTELDLMTLAKVYLAQKEPDKALDILIPLLYETDKRGRKISIVENLVMQAQAIHLKGLTEEALSKLETALLLAEPIGIIRVFLNEGKPLQELLIKLVAQWSKRTKKEMALSDPGEQYTNGLIMAFDSGSGHTIGASISEDKSTPGVGSFKIFEPLTKRENEVLDQLAQGFSNKEIAQNLMIASGTVHKHLKNIYSKLDVHSRTAAIVRAREIGLL